MRSTGAAGSEKDDITNRLIERLKDLIARRVLLPGSKLPPERELAPAFGVSRSSLRHALKALEIMGVLTQRVGDGTYLTANSDDILSQPFELLMLIDDISLDDLLETRMIVEPELAARAAQRATIDELQAMKETLEIPRGRATEAEMIQADLAFHQAIFRAARNPICTRLFSLIHRAMATSIGLTARMVDWEHTLAFHRPIFLAIEKRQPLDARVAMIAHLSDAKHLLDKREAKPKAADVKSMIQPISRSNSRRPKPGRASIGT
jgi:GntR family transcriptional repressor for pyruvate dehydrogenase complex